MHAEPLRPVPQIVFINGFHRSGTTVLASAVTDALGGVTTTVGVLARHIGTLRAFVAGGSEAGADRGVDRLRVDADTSEEYGVLLHHRVGTRSLYGRPGGVPLLRTHIAELAAAAPHAMVVLKNPWDVGREAQMLADFPGARIIIVRRRLADVEASLSRALARTTASAYARALDPDTAGHRRFQRHMASSWQRPLLLEGYRLALRGRACRLARSVRTLPIDRVALLSYDELREDPRAGAAWAAHLVDPDALAHAFTHRSFAENGDLAPSSALQDAIDRYWQRAWEEMRAAQVRASIITVPSRSSTVHEVRRAVNGTCVPPSMGTGSRP
jgi:hypothetical protein